MPDWLTEGIVVAFLVGFAVGVLYSLIAARRGREEAETTRRDRW